MDSHPSRRLGVDRDVVDKDRPVRIDRKARQHDLVDARVGLDDPDLARNHPTMEPAEEIEPLERRREGLGRKIAEQVERRAARSELGQNLDRAGDRTGHHFVKAGAIGIDQLGFASREPSRRFGNGLYLWQLNLA